MKSFSVLKEDTFSKKVHTQTEYVDYGQLTNHMSDNLSRIQTFMMFWAAFTSIG